MDNFKKTRLLPFLFAFLIGSVVDLSGQQKVAQTDFVDPMIGTGGHGHTYPGATVPFGMVQLSPDTDDTGWDWCSGYQYIDSTVMGFSHTHLSGTGISDLADILVMPYLGKISLQAGNKQQHDSGYRSSFSHAREIAQPGYYAVHLDKPSIYAELTASRDMGYHRYTFPASDSANIIIDLLHGLDRHRSWLTERVLESALQVVDSVTVSGYRISTGWSNVQTVYFQMRFSKPMKRCGVALHDVFYPDVKLMRGRNVKGVCTFSTTQNEQVEIAVRISDKPFSDTLRQCLPFEQARKEAKKLWQQEFDRIQIEAPDSIKTIFYTAWYHTALAPNKMGRVDSQIEDQLAFSDEYSALSQWDTYRAAFALNTLFRPEVTNGILGTMLRAADKNGYLPVWKLWHDDVHCMIGTPSVPIVTEAAMKGYGGDKLPLIKDALIRTMSLDNPVAPWSLLDRYGYVPVREGELFSVSKTLEMAFASACARDFMRTFFPNEKKWIQLYDQRAGSYRNVFDRQTGFFRGRNERGDWSEPFDPSMTQEGAFVEATPWQYLFHAHHDIGGMMALHGGVKPFAAKLDSLFRAGGGKVDAHILDITGLVGQYAHGNEPCHHVAYLYNDAGKPWEAQRLAYQLCTKMYTSGPDGLCGNEDCGQMSAWYVFSALGLYPVHPASGQYQLGVPIVDQAECKLGNGKSLIIQTHKSNDYSSKEVKQPGEWKYVREVRFDGKRLKRPVISHDQLMGGGKLEFFLSCKPEFQAFEE
ncbi:MAG: GH92 family glycosyl hydrolase [Saprospiraceae bacterium]|jgi:predicted alpha-1,2-mannosidase|nr:GH92 family glycosyl hydrolase [Saprospiraceae bacterium]